MINLIQISSFANDTPISTYSPGAANHMHAKSEFYEDFDFQRGGELDL